MKGNSKSRGVYAEGTSFLTHFYAVLCSEEACWRYLSG